MRSFMRLVLFVWTAVGILPWPLCGQEQAAARPGLRGAFPDPETFVDVVARGADPTGVADSTDAIQAAIRDSVEQRKVCYFPAGTYRISRTLRIVVDGSGGGDGNGQAAVLLGAPEKPTIVLAPRAQLDPTRYVFHCWSRAHRHRRTDWDGDGDVDTDDQWATPYTPDREQPNTFYNTKLINLRIRIEQGNPGAVAIRMRGAQGTGVQDVEIELLEETAVGLSGACGSGGSHFALHVTGGRVGLDLSDGQPAPTIAGVVLVDQSEAAIVYGGRQALTAVGCEIRSRRCQGPLLRTPARTESPNGQISLLDSMVEFTDGQPANKTAIATSSTLFLQNVYIRGAATLVSRLEESGTMQPRVVSPSPAAWVHIQRYALPRHVAKPVFHRASDNYYSFPVYVDGVRLPGELPAVVRPASPPHELIQRHLWDRFPSLADAVVVPAGSDSRAIQQALDQNRGKVVFLPKGTYSISQTIRLYRDTTLVGAGRHLTVLRAVPGYDHGPLVETEDVPDATTQMAFLKLELPASVGPHAYALRWRCGGKALIRSVNFQSRFTGGPALQSPFVLVTGHGGGRWYEFFNTNSANNQGADYRHLLIRDTPGPLRIYQCNPEHAIPGGKTSRGVKNLPQMEIVGAKFIAIYGLKSEGNNPVLWARNCDHLLLTGTGGNASAMKDSALYVFEDVPNFLCANLVDSPRATTSDYLRFSGAAVDPENWSMLRDVQKGNVVDTRREQPPSRGADRPVLYLRGQPQSEP